MSFSFECDTYFTCILNIHSKFCLFSLKNRTINNNALLELLSKDKFKILNYHWKQVMFTFRRYNRGFDEFEEEIEDPSNSHPIITSASGASTLEEERMGFIMFEAGLENICIKLVSPSQSLSMKYFLFFYFYFYLT